MPGGPDARTVARPRAARASTAGARGRPGLVQGELAAREDARPRPARLRPGPEQRGAQPAGRHPRHPRRAVGQVRLGGSRQGLRGLGRPPRGCVLRDHVPPRARPAGRRCSCLAGSATPTRPWRTAPPTPTWSTSTGARASTYVAVDLADPTAAIPWPIPLADAEVSAKDQQNPSLDAVDADAAATHADPRPRRAARSGSGRRASRDADRRRPRPAGPHRPRGRRRLALGRVRRCAQRRGIHRRRRGRDARGEGGCLESQRHVPATTGRGWPRRHRFTLVHYSTDYVFDGTSGRAHRGRTVVTAGVYAQTKAAGDLAVATTPRHYLLRTSWVVGDGKNFVATMRSLAERGVHPSVVDDQVGRLSFATELARATRHLLDTGAAHGTYNVTNAGAPTSAGPTLAREIFRLCGRDDSRRDAGRAPRSTPPARARARGRRTAFSTSTRSRPPASFPRTPSSRWPGT